MIRIRQILCPVDFSPFSERALQYATALARWYDAEILAIHAYTIVVVPSPASEFPVAIPVASPERQEELARDLERFVGAARQSGLRVKTTIATGNPVSAVLSAARESAADLIVMGTHGLSGFERLVLGSVTEKVLRKAPCPVLTVPKAAHDAPPTAGGLFRRILCPIDFSTWSEKAMRFALSLAQEAGGALTLVNIVESFVDEVAMGHTLADEYRRQIESVAGERLRAMVPDEARVWCDVQTIVAAGKPYREILRLASELPADLIVMGVHGRNPLDLMLFGSTTSHVVRSAACPVLTIRG